MAFLLILAVFFLILIYQEYQSENVALIKPLDPMIKHNGIIKSNNEVLNKIKAGIKNIGSLTRHQKTRQRFLDSTRYFKKSADDLASVKKYPEVPMFFTHRDVHMCGTTTYKMLILVFSENENAMLRQTIRRSWGGLHLPAIELRWRVIYIVGRPLDLAGSDEKFFNEVMGNDLLGIHAKNSRTMQALYGALYWALNGCSFEKLLVMQDNMLLNIKGLYEGMHKLQMKLIKQVYMNSLSSLPKSEQKPTEQPTESNPKINTLKVFNPNGAWLMSRDYLTELLPKIRIFMNSDFEGTAVLIDEFMLTSIGVESRKSKYFFSKSTARDGCTFHSKMILTLQHNSSCIEQIYNEKLKNL